MERNYIVLKVWEPGLRIHGSKAKWYRRQFYFHLWIKEIEDRLCDKWTLSLGNYEKKIPKHTPRGANEKISADTKPQKLPSNRRRRRQYLCENSRRNWTMNSSSKSCAIQIWGTWFRICHVSEAASKNIWWCSATMCAPAMPIHIFYTRCFLRTSRDLSLYLRLALHHSSSEQCNALDRQWIRRPICFVWADAYMWWCVIIEYRTVECEQWVIIMDGQHTDACISLFILVRLYGWQLWQLCCRQIHIQSSFVWKIDEFSWGQAKTNTPVLIDWCIKWCVRSFNSYEWQTSNIAPYDGYLIVGMDDDGDISYLLLGRNEAKRK